MILVIAEKPQLANDIAAVLPGQRKKVNNDYYEVGNYIVTWVFGHLLTLREPEDYDPIYADKRNIGLLPIYFDNWGTKIKESEDGSIKKRVNMIGGLIKKAEYVIHAGDPDDEGQLLIDELLQWHHYTGRVMRINTNNTTHEALSQAMGNLFDNNEWANLGKAAYARSVADFIVGINLTRFFSSLNHTHLPVGRVKLPTLGLVIARDEEIENHQKTYYYELFGNILLGQGLTVKAKYMPAKNDLNVTDGKILDKRYLEEKATELAGFRGPITISKETVASKPPLPFNMVKLQVYCSSKFNYTPEQTMSITQSLREKHKAITYNRSDCQYLSEAHYKEAPKTVATALESLGEKIPGIDFKIKSKCFNDSKITAHFAIIPSGQKVDLSAFTEQEKKVYIAIAHRYIAQFLPDAKKERTVMTMPLPDGASFRATSTIIKSPGFLSLLGKSDDDDDEQSPLSNLPAGGDNGTVLDCNVEEKETKPKPRYTEATLIEDMTRIARYVDDPYVRSLLLEKDKDDDSLNGSIGTDATRYKIVSEIIELGYVRRDGKHIISTTKGREFYRILPHDFKTADLTAHWWVIQEDIKSGKKQPSDLTESVLSAVSEVLTQDFPKLDASLCVDGARPSLGPCPLCGAPVVEGQKGFGCSAWRTGCAFVLWKSSDRGPFAKMTMTPAIVKKLLAGKSVQVSNLWSDKSQKTFPGKISLEKDPEQKSGVSLRISLEKESLGKCPVCNGDVVEGARGYGCANWKHGCKFTIWKTGSEGSLLSKTTITKAMAKKLLKGETVEGVTLYSKTKEKTYTAGIRLESNPEAGTYYVAPVIKATGETVGKCPRCGGSVVETMFSYQCENSTTGCRYKIQKTASKGLLCKTTITPEMATALMKGEHLKVTSLYVEKTKQKFTGKIYLDDTELSDYGPAIKIDRDTVGKCPRCGGVVTETLFNYQCENNESGCKYRIQKKAQKGLLCKTEITPMMAKKLIAGEHLDVTTLFSSNKNKTFSGRIYLDDSEQSDYGPAIKLEPFK